MAVVIGIDPYIDRFKLLPKTYDNKTTNPCSTHEPSHLHLFDCGMTFATPALEMRDINRARV